MEELAALIPAGQLHRHHLSGKSSQLIGLGLLGAAAKQDPSLLWLEALLSPIPPFSISPPQVRFEYELDKTVLNEQPRVTAVDFLVDTDDVVICGEVKFAEEGMGRCSCGVGAGAVGQCSQKAYFRQTNSWSGWPEVLRSTLHTADSNNQLRFRAISSQSLVLAMPLPNPVRQWAYDKHQLP